MRVLQVVPELCFNILSYMGSGNDRKYIIVHNSEKERLGGELGAYLW